MHKTIFPCTQCGCCCKRIGRIKKNGLIFPYKTKNDGTCEMLSRDNKCKVYDSRPILCNISELAKILNRDIKEFYVENARECNKIMEEDKVPKRFRVILKK